MDKFKFSGPVVPADQGFILSSMKESLVSALKSLKEYSLLYGMVLRIFFKARRMGIRLTAVQSAFVLGIMISVAVVAIAGGIALAPGLLTTGKNIKPIGNEVKNADDSGTKTMGLKMTEKDSVGKKKSETAPVKAYRLGIEGFGNENTGKEKSAMVTERISAGLVRRLGGALEGG